MKNSAISKEEIKSGNYFKFHSINDSGYEIPHNGIIQIDEYAISQINSNVSLPMEGLPLTIGWLVENFAFQNISTGDRTSHIYFAKNYYYLLVDTEPVESNNNIFWFFGQKNKDDKGYTHKLHYVHQLQNHYKELTGYDLNVLDWAYNPNKSVFTK